MSAPTTPSLLYRVPEEEEIPDVQPPQRSAPSGVGAPMAPTMLRVQARVLPLAGVTLASVTIATTTILALGHGHVHFPPLFMISDTAVYPPEKYVFRLGIVSAAVLLFITCFVEYAFIKKQGLLHQRIKLFGRFGVSECLGLEEPSASYSSIQTANSTHGPVRRPVDLAAYLSMNAGTFLCSAGCIGLAICACVSEKEDNTVHSVAAFLFFLFFTIHMAIVTSLAWGLLSKGSRVIKIITTITALICLILFILKKHGNGAWFEWIGTIAILLFNASYALDYGKDLAFVLTDEHRGSAYSSMRSVDGSFFDPLT